MYVCPSVCQLLSADDLSGLRVTSSERVSVVVSVVDNVEHLVTISQLTPVNHWHTEYLHVGANALTFRVIGMIIYRCVLHVQVQVGYDIL